MDHKDHNVRTKKNDPEGAEALRTSSFYMTTRKWVCLPLLNAEPLWSQQRRKINMLEQRWVEKLWNTHSKIHNYKANLTGSKTSSTIIPKLNANLRIKNQKICSMWKKTQINKTTRLQKTTSPNKQHNPNPPELTLRKQKPDEKPKLNNQLKKPNKPPYTLTHTQRRKPTKSTKITVQFSIVLNAKTKELSFTSRVFPNWTLYCHMFKELGMWHWLHRIEGGALRCAWAEQIWNTDRMKNFSCCPKKSAFVTPISNTPREHHAA